MRAALSTASRGDRAFLQTRWACPGAHRAMRGPIQVSKSGEVAPESRGHCSNCRCDQASPSQGPSSIASCTKGLPQRSGLITADRRPQRAQTVPRGRCGSAGSELWPASLGLSPPPPRPCADWAAKGRPASAHQGTLCAGLIAACYYQFTVFDVVLCSPRLVASSVHCCCSAKVCLHVACRHTQPLPVLLNR